jgi:hypothetical protein
VNFIINKMMVFLFALMDLISNLYPGKSKSSTEESRHHLDPFPSFLLNKKSRCRSGINIWKEWTAYAKAFTLFVSLLFRLLALFL